MLIEIHKNVNNHSGMTLIELILATTMALLLMGFLMGIYLASQRSSQLQTALINIQDNANSAITILNADIRQAGFIGCARLALDFSVTPYSSYSLTVQNKLIGGTSEIIVRHIALESVLLLKLKQDGSMLYTRANTLFSPGNILMISDCEHAEIFQVASVFMSQQRQVIIPSHPLRQSFKPYAEVSRLEMNKYFIAKSRQFKQKKTNDYALFREDIQHRKTILVDGIHALHFRYSVFQNGMLQEISAQEVRDWSAVVGVAIDFDVFSAPIKKERHMYIALERAS